MATLRVVNFGRMAIEFFYMTLIREYITVIYLSCENLSLMPQYLGILRLTRLFFVMEHIFREAR